jgi:hypothetical protein
MRSHLTCKIRFEAPKRQRERERERDMENREYGKDAVSAKFIYNNNVCAWSEHEISLHYHNR